MNDEYTEEEKREIILEATIAAMFETFTELENRIPFSLPALNTASSIMDALFNGAEIRSNIKDLVKLEVELED